MRYIYFKKAGRYKDNEPAFLTSRTRFKSLKDQYNHRNDYETVYRIPEDFFKKHFRYSAFNGIYHNALKYADLHPYKTIVKFYNNLEISCTYQ